jgi:hypothetical protein
LAGCRSSTLTHPQILANIRLSSQGVLTQNSSFITLAHSTDPGRRAEIPEDDNNHALGALRYLIAKLDARKLGRKPKVQSAPQPENKEKPKEKKWLSLKNEALWSQIWTVDR